MKNYLMLTLAMASLALTAGCGNKNSPAAAAQQAKDKVNAAKTAATLAGNWTSACAALSPIPAFKSTRTEYNFANDGSFSKKLFFYSDDASNGCKNPSFVRDERGHYEQQGTSTIQQGVPVNFNFIEVSVVADSEDGAKILNGLKYCKQDTYAVGKAVSVTAASGDALACLGVDKSPRATFDTIKLVDDNHLGIAGDALNTDSTKVPTNIDNNKLLTRM